MGRGERIPKVALYFCDDICKPVEARVLGIKELKKLNSALPAKLGWRMLKCPNQL